MRLVDDFDTVPPFEVLAPAEQRAPLVFNSPHSGRCYPKSFVDASQLAADAIRRSEDVLVDDLFKAAPENGAILMRANFPRAFLDVNREPYELDPKMFDGRLPDYVNARSIRVAGGLGTIARLVSETQEIYRGRLSVEEGLGRIESLYMPYHKALRRLLAHSHVNFGYAVLIDCHSMPSTVRGSYGKMRPDIILGDRYGASCSPELTRTVISILSDLGYAVSRNKPYAGGFISEHYGRPVKGLHALQIEINRALYMDEKTYEPHEGFERIAGDMTRLIGELAALPGADFWPDQAAAE